VLDQTSISESKVGTVKQVVYEFRLNYCSLIFSFGMRVCFGPGILTDLGLRLSVRFALAEQQPLGSAVRLHCATLVYGSLASKEDANVIYHWQLNVKSVAIIVFSYPIHP